MSKKMSIEQQVAELTPEQKNNLLKAWKKYVKISIAIVVLMFIALIGMYVEAGIRVEEANDKYERIQTQIALNEYNGGYDSSLYSARYDAWDELYDAKQDQNRAFIICGGAGFVAALVTLFVFKKKYPHFSEKKCRYLKKMEKKANENKTVVE